jgi:hypothetical protein
MANANDTSPAFSPSPWRVRKATRGDPDTAYWIENADGIAIAVVKEHERGRAKRNARLIAAAPDLLEACRAALWEVT